MPVPVNTASPAPPIDAWTTVYFNGADNYVCAARSFQPTSTLAITNVVVLTNTGTVNATAHGLLVGNQIVISGSATTALNGTYIIATVPNANSFTITTSGVADATYTDATITTNAPQTCLAIWSIYKVFGGGTPTRTAWADGNTSADNIADNRATLAYL